MKKPLSNSTLILSVLVSAYLPGPNAGLLAQPQFTAAQLANLHPVSPSLVPRVGNFYRLSQPGVPPEPTDPCPSFCPVYLLPDGRSWLVTNPVAAARSLLTAQRNLASQQLLAAPMADDSGPPPVPDGTNSPPDTYYPPVLLDPASVPTNATWFMLVQTNWPPFPGADPCPADYPVYALCDGTYLVDDTGFSWPTPTGGTGGGTSSPQPLYATSDFYLEIKGVTNGMANLILHGTSLGTTYTILSRTSWSPADPWDAEMPLTGADTQTPFQVPTFGRSVLYFRAQVGTVLPNLLRLYTPHINGSSLNVILKGTTEGTSYDLLSVGSIGRTNNWAVETNFAAATGQYWTAVSIPLLGRPGLFLKARSYVDSTGSGIPDWWFLDYGETNSDPYALCPSGDGWTLYQAYENNWNPHLFYTPPAPTGLTVTYPAGGGSVTITWNSSPGPVLSYTLERCIPQAIQTNDFAGLPSNSTLYVDTTFPYVNPASVPGWRPYYRIMAHYAGGDSAWSQPVCIYPCDDPSSSLACFVRGPQGLPYLMVPMLPADVTTVRLFGTMTNDPLSSADSISWDIPRSVFTNGGYVLSGDQAAAVFQVASVYGQWVVETMNSASNITGSMTANSYAFSPLPFYDGREQLKENLAFLLRAADSARPFELTFSGWPQYDWPLGPFPYGTLFSYSSYAYSGLYDLDEFWDRSWGFLDEYVPFENNYIYRNFAFAVGEVNPATNGCFTTGASWDWGYDDYALSYPPTYLFQTSYLQSAVSPVLSPSECQWILPRNTFPSGDPDVGLNYANGQFYLGNNATNLFGLALLSLNVGYKTAQGEEYTVLYPGGSSFAASNSVNNINSETAQPDLQTIGYYFCRPLDWNYTDASTDLLPGHSGFSPTNSTPLIIIPANTPFKIAGYARQIIGNGDHSKYAFLGQYFDKAYMANPDGTPSAIETGVLSEYGDFFPTEPGTVILATKPDLSQTNNLQGYCTINVIKLALDVNHDGIMDLSFAGPDNTSRARPFVFWVNNDHDEPGTGGNADQDLPVPPNRPDYTYGAVRCQRNLEDFARLWVCGLPKLPSNQGYTVTLTMSSLSGYPSLNLYAVYGTNSGIGYLTDSNAAAAQFTQNLLNGQVVFDYSKKVGTVSPDQSYTLPFNSDGSAQFTNFLFEAAGTNGSAQLTLTISQTTAQGTNVLAQASAWLDFHDIKDFYEQALVTNVVQEWPDMVEQDPASGFQIFSHANVNAGDVNQLAVFVHGWRVPETEYFMFAETMFKRLYWQGFQGSFATLRWPTRSADTDPFFHLDFVTYNRSEHIAFESASGAADYFNDLRQRFPDYTISVCAHSMGNIVMMQTLGELAAAGRAPIDNYVLMQAAVPAQCYDTTVTNHPLFTVLEQTIPTPNTYSNYAATAAAALRPGGQMVNFFNPVDFALSIAWVANQGFDVGSATGPVTMKPNTLLGYYTDGTTHVLRTNSWNQSVLSLLYRGFYNGPTRSVTNLNEVMPFVARPRTKAVGAQSGVQGQIHGEEVDLQAQFGFGGAASDHSGQWNRNIQDPAVGPFYFKLRENLFPPQP